MRKIIVSIVAASLLVSSSANAGRSRNVEKSINIRVSPLLLFGVFNAKVDVKVKKNVAIGGIVDYTSRAGGFYSVGGAANIMLSGRDIMSSDGWLFNPYFTYSSGKSGLLKKERDTEYSNKTVGGLLSYQWMWKSGYNFRLGFGAQYNSADVYDINVLPDFSLTFGWAI